MAREVDLLTTYQNHPDIWLAIKLDNQTKDTKTPHGVWRDYYTGHRLNDYTKPWMINADSGHFVKMSFIEIENGTGVWQWNRKTYTVNKVGCPCQNSILELRGLCPTSLLAGQNKVRGIQYVPQQDGSHVVFQGGISTKIAAVNHKWKITAANLDAYAISEAQKGTYALGKHTWNIHSDECQKM